jgi:hypothetical protein
MPARHKTSRQYGDTESNIFCFTATAGNFPFTFSRFASPSQLLYVPSKMAKFHALRQAGFSVIILRSSAAKG